MACFPGERMTGLATGIHLAFAPLRRALERPRLDRDNWWLEPANVALLCTWAAGEGFTARELARLSEKPWKWRVEFVVAWCRAADGEGGGRPRGAAA